MVDIANLVIQTLIGIATFAAVCISLWQVRYEKRLREEESKRQQAIRVSLWYEGGRNRTDCPKDDRFVWKSVVLRNESESPVYDVIVTCVGISGAGPERKGENSKADFPCRFVSVRYRLVFGMCGCQRKGRACMCGRHPRRPSPMRARYRGCVEVTGCWNRFSQDLQLFMGSNSLLVGADARCFSDWSKLQLIFLKRLGVDGCAHIGWRTCS